jgi:hypothetical protein
MSTDKVANIILNAIKGAESSKYDLVRDQINAFTPVIVDLQEKGHPVEMVARTLRSIAYLLDGIEDYDAA